MGPFEDSIFIYGTTHASANTQSLIKNPLRRTDVWVRVHAGKGIYVEDAGTNTNGMPTGIAKLSLDIRSTDTAEPYIIELIIRVGTPNAMAAVAYP